jgi:hypothetical protein
VPPKCFPSPGLDHVTDGTEKSFLHVSISLKLFPSPHLHLSHANCNMMFLGTFILRLCKKKNFQVVLCRGFLLPLLCRQRRHPVVLTIRDCGSTSSTRTLARYAGELVKVTHCYVSNLLRC